MSENIVKVFKVHSGALLPVRSTPMSAGLDLFCCDNGVIAAGTRTAINIGVRIALPSNTYGRIAPRSGLALSQCIDIAGRYKFLY
jgi:dUTP pyrophosphatase